MLHTAGNDKDQIHNPFCNGKCPYCDFYSVTPDDETVKNYVAKVCEKIKAENSISTEGEER